jgi:dienelactone hydrolase
MQDDITWGVKYLVAEGIADPKRIGILGGSYGGYARWPVSPSRPICTRRRWTSSDRRI